MEVVLSIVAGLGLRLFLASATDEGNSNKLTTALLGVWEGVVVHQVSGRSESPKFDHLLAYGLRLVIDLLASKDVQRMAMVILCSGIAATVSESVTPYAVLRSEIKNGREREKERRHKPTHTEPFTIPILSTPLPPRVRAYKPDHLPVTSTPAPLAQEPIPSTPQFEPPSPPSFWLQEPDISDIYSPAPKQVQVSVIQKPKTSPTDSDALPVRPHSGVAAILESNSPPPIPVPFPTPPDSAVPSDGQLDNNNDSKNDSKSRFERHLYTIPEMSSSEGGSPPADTEAQNQVEASAAAEPQSAHMSASATMAPLPVPNAHMGRLPSSNLSQWLANTSDADAVFTHPFSPTNSPPGPAPLPVPVRIRQQDLSPQVLVPARLGKVEEDAESVVANDDDDMLRTPPASKGLPWNTDPDPDPDPLQTPRQLDQPPENILSPLTLDVKSGLDSQSEFSREPTPTRDEPQSATIEDLPIPGSLSKNTLLHPPLPPSGSLFRKSTPPPELPPSPSISNHSGLSEISVLSTRIPKQLYGRGEELRRKAREGEKIRAELEDERRRAEREGRPLEALSLRIKVRDLDNEAQKLHEKAARRYYAGMFTFLVCFGRLILTLVTFEALNTVEISDKIDVHGLRPREAFDRIERTIVKASSEGKSVVRVIVGKGLHSMNQQPTLKPAVQREMQRFVKLMRSHILSADIPDAD